MISEFILKEISKNVINFIGKSVKNTNIASYTKEKDVLEGLEQHMKFVNIWSSEVNFSDLKQSKNIKDVYVQLYLYVQPLRVRLTDTEEIEKLEIRQLFRHSEKRHFALLGQVGAGKTTSLKFLCQSLLFNDSDLFDNEVCYPIVIKLNDFNSLKDNDFARTILFNELIKILHINFNFQNLDERAIENFKEATVFNFLNENNILLCLDGLDEITFKNRKEIVIKEFEKLVNNVTLSRIILTSRTSDYRYSFSNVNLFEICPLTDIQILTFAKKWLADEIAAEDFIDKMKKSPFYDTAIRPLTIAHLCAIYERNKTIPEKPKTVYRKIVMLLLEEWNLQRNIIRTSKYAGFENDRKFDFLSSMSYHLTVSKHSTAFSREDMEGVYRRIFQDFDLEKNEITTVINEIESHNGLIMQTGYDKFEFAHKSIQEYLTAEYLVKLPTILESRRDIIRLPNEMAIATAISSKPSEYFVELVINRIATLKLGVTFIKSFVSRLILEKIDFNKQSKVRQAALLLYSVYIESIRSESQQLRIFYFDDLIDEFEIFIDEIFARNDKAEFFSHYEVKQELTTETVPILVLGLKKNIKNNMPQLLYCRKSFLRNLDSIRF